MPHIETSCCFTGHRPAKLPWRYNEADPACLALKQKIADAVEAVYGSGVRHFLCGMAQGCDLYFCEAVLALREQHPEVTLECAIPWTGQAGQWPEAQQRRYRALVDRCDYRTVVQETYSPDCMRRRNRYMVDNASVVIGAYNGSGGGTLQTLQYALRQKKEVVIIEF